MATSRQASSGAGAQDEDTAVGPPLRAAREKQGISLRKLAGRIDISPSALSQIETGRSRPSVRTLYAIVSELGLSLDDLFVADSGSGPVPQDSNLDDGHPTPAGGPDSAGDVEGSSDEHVTRAAARMAIELDSGVRWERLNAGERDAEFLVVRYEVGGASSTSQALSRHAGREYGLVLSGRLRVQIGWNDYDLEPGDSIRFDSTIPHRLSALGDEPVEAVWFVIGRRDTDPRATWD